MIGMSIKGLEAFLPKASRSVRGVLFWEGKLPFSRTYMFFWTVDCGFLSEVWASPGLICPGTLDKHINFTFLQHSLGTRQFCFSSLSCIFSEKSPNWYRKLQIVSPLTEQGEATSQVILFRVVGGQLLGLLGPMISTRPTCLFSGLKNHNVNHNLGM